MTPSKQPRRKALITGITGQDGSYLAEFLLSKDYQVYGMARRTSHDAHERIRPLLNKIHLVPGDLADQSSLDRLIEKVGPDEIYNLAGQSCVSVSWDQPVLTGDITALGSTRLLEAIRRVKPDARFYQASSSEMFGNARKSPQNEETPFYPRSPYAAAKAYAHAITVNYRESHGIFACCGICFNHESPRRSPEFVTRSITQGAAAIKLGLAKKLPLGNLDARRDWGFAGDYVPAMWMMLQQKNPQDFVIATGQTHSVREFAQEAFRVAGLDWAKHVVTDAALFRPAEVDSLTGDASKARKLLGWKPSVDFISLVQMMVESDLMTMNRGLVPVPA